MEHLATVEQVSARVTEPIESAEEKALAEAMLWEASAWVRHYGGQPWPTRAGAPEVASVIAAAAASRGYMNPAGFEMERGDMSTLNRSPEYAAGTMLTASEIAMLSGFSRGRKGLASVSMVNHDRPRPAHRNRSDFYRDRGYVQMNDGNEKPFPLGVE